MEFRSTCSKAPLGDVRSNGQPFGEDEICHIAKDVHQSRGGLNSGSRYQSAIQIHVTVCNCPAAAVDWPQCVPLREIVGT